MSVSKATFFHFSFSPLGIFFRGILEKDLNRAGRKSVSVKQMETSQEEKGIKKLSKFLSETHIAHYVCGSSLYVPGKVTYINLSRPMEIRVQQDNDMVIRILKGDDKVYVDALKGLSVIQYGSGMQNIEFMYQGGELEIHFLNDWE